MVYEVKSCLKSFFEEAVRNQSGIPCVQVEAQTEDLDAAIALGEKLAAERPDELLEVREYPGDVCVWVF